MVIVSHVSAERTQQQGVKWSAYVTATNHNSRQQIWCTVHTDVPKPVAINGVPANSQQSESTVCDPKQSLLSRSLPDEHCWSNRVILFQCAAQAGCTLRPADHFMALSHVASVQYFSNGSSIYWACCWHTFEQNLFVFSLLLFVPYTCLEGHQNTVTAQWSQMVE